MGKAPPRMTDTLDFEGVLGGVRIVALDQHGGRKAACMGGIEVDGEGQAVLEFEGLARRFGHEEVAGIAG